MPQFRWFGIDLGGRMHSGTMMARSVDELSSVLFNDEIALLKCTLKKPLPFIQSVPLHVKIEFFKQLGLLLSSGIFLDQALYLIVHQIKNRFFKTVVQDILIDIQHGVSLSRALRNYATIFDDVTISMVEAGQESGDLVQALKELCDHQEMFLHFKKKVQSILLMPAITFLFFIGIALIIFTIIVPTFSVMFVSANQPMTRNTEYMILLSDFLRSRWSVIAGLIIVCAVGVIKYYVLTCASLKKIVQQCLLKTPVIGTLIRTITFAYFFQSLALLTKSGVHLITAFSISYQSIGNIVLKQYIEQIYDALSQGNSLSQSVNQQSHLFSDHIMALISVGQESGC